MDSFPSDFNFTSAQQKLQTQIIMGEEMAKARKNVFDTYSKYLSSGSEHFRINLKGMKEIIKAQLIKELFERFSFIGYVESTPHNSTQTDMEYLLSGLMGINLRQPTKPETSGPQFDRLSEFDAPSWQTVGNQNSTTQVPPVKTHEPSKRRVIKLTKGTFVSADEYIIALTEKFAKDMPAYYV